MLGQFEEPFLDIDDVESIDELNTPTYSVRNSSIEEERRSVIAIMSSIDLNNVSHEFKLGYLMRVAEEICSEDPNSLDLESTWRMLISSNKYSN